MSARNVLLFLRLSRPHFLLGSLLLYALGAAIARYLGVTIDASRYLVGQALVWLIQLMAHYLNEYHDAPRDQDNASRTWFSGGSGALGEGGLRREVALYAGIVCLAAAALIVVYLLLLGMVPLMAWLVLLLAFLGAYFYSQPPLRLLETGVGEAVAAVVVAGLVPTFAFALQTGSLHRLLLMSTTPLVALCLAMILAFELPDYASDLRHGKRNLMIRADWQIGMRLHDAAILFAFATLLMAGAFGLPRRVVLGSLIAAPLGLAQIWQMYRIRQGAPPRWRVLTLGAAGLFGLTTYLELAGYLLS